MARYWFNADVSAASQRNTFPVYTDEALTVAATDLLSESGDAITVVTRDEDFQGPDGVTTLWGRVSNDTNVAPVRFDAIDAPAPSTGGSQVAVVVSKTSAYSAVSGDVVLADASGADFSVTLPEPTSGTKVTVKNVGATGTVTVEPHVAETIDGEASYPIQLQWMSRDFLADGTDWMVV